MQALGLILNINQATHNQGNTLDHIYTESIDTLGVRHSFIGEYISDHRLVGIQINKKKATTQLDNQPRRQFKELDLDNFIQEFRNEEILKHRELGEIWSALEEELKRTLSKIIPEEKQKKTPRPPRPWYTSSLLDQRKIELEKESSSDIGNNTSGEHSLEREIDTSKCLDSAKEVA